MVTLVEKNFNIWAQITTVRVHFGECLSLKKYYCLFFLALVMNVRSVPRGTAHIFGRYRHPETVWIFLSKGKHLAPCYN